VRLANEPHWPLPGKSGIAPEATPSAATRCWMTRIAFHNVRKIAYDLRNN
jgi:hypothetical protein